MVDAGRSDERGMEARVEEVGVPPMRTGEEKTEREMGGKKRG